MICFGLNRFIILLEWILIYYLIVTGWLVSDPESPIDMYEMDFKFLFI